MSTLQSIGGMGGLSSPPAQRTDTMGRDQFLRLLTAQLGNQDPLEPMDSSAFVAQLAQFASVEQLQAQSASLETLILAQAANNQMQAASLVGRSVRFQSSGLTLAGEGGVGLTAELSAPATTLTAVIRDEGGRVVRTLNLGASAAGVTRAQWDGRDDSGRTLPQGDYTVEYAAADVTGAPVNVSARGEGQVTGVSFQNGFPELLLGGLRISMSDVIEVQQQS